MTEDQDNLIHRYLSGTITPSEMQSLEKRLLQSEEARRELRTLATIDSKCRQRAESKLSGLTFPDTTSPRNPAKSFDWPIKLNSWMAGAGIFALLALSLGLAWLLASQSSLDKGIATGIARVIRVEGDGAEPDRQLSAGKFFSTGEVVEMQDGLIEFAFHETGVHVLATAPLKIRIDSARRVFLHEGEVKLHVPPQGTGFVVETVDRQITDLGTSFVITARKKESKILVLDGQIAVSGRDGESDRLMNEGELASFDPSGAMNLHSRRPSGVPELTLPAMQLNPDSLPGTLLAFDPDSAISSSAKAPDPLGQRLLSLLDSDFKDRSCLNGLKQAPIRFTGVAGTYNQFPARTKLTPYKIETGWLAWYHGKVTPPQSGRYRFWGYADNSLLVAVDGKPVFEGSRNDEGSPWDSAFRRQLTVPRGNHPGWPCLNASAGFASGPWIEVGIEPIQIDVIFGETAGCTTSALLLIEREGANYQSTYWGQPKWPVFLTESPSNAERVELAKLRLHMEEKLRGSFSVSDEAIWKVQNQK